MWSPKLFSNTTATYSRYNFNTLAKDLTEQTQPGFESVEDFSLEYDSGIDDLGAKIDFDYVPNPDHFIRFGAGIINHRFNPGVFNLGFRISDAQNTADTIIAQDVVNAQELSLYL